MTPHDYTKTELHSQPFGATITVKRRVELVRAASVSPMAASTCATSRKERERAAPLRWIALGPERSKSPKSIEHFN
jgi:hypothetical protein